MSAFIIIGLFVNLRFLSLFEKVIFWSFTHLKSIEIVSFLCLSFFESRESWKLVLWSRLVFIKLIKIREMDWFLAVFFPLKIFWPIGFLVSLSKLRKPDWFFLIVRNRLLYWDSFILENSLSYKFIRFCSNFWIWKGWSVDGISSTSRISLIALNILKLVKVESFILLVSFNWKFPTFIHSFDSLCFINWLVFGHGLKRVVHVGLLDYFCLFDVNFFERCLLANGVKFLCIFRRLKFVFWRLFEGVCRLVVCSVQVVACCLKWILKRVLPFAFCKASVHFKVQNRRFVFLWNFTLAIIIEGINWLGHFSREFLILKWILDFRYWFLSFIIRKLTPISLTLIILIWLSSLPFPKVRIFVIIRISLAFVELKWVLEGIV